MTAKNRLIVALDVDSEDKAIRMLDRLKSDVRFFKVGLELFSSCGPKIVELIREKGREVFLDLKFHDIPNTAAKATAAVTRLGPFMFNVHALGGYDMMKATADVVTDEAKRLNIDRPKIIAVTVLTSMDEKELKKIGVNGNMNDTVLRLAGLARKAGLDGVVASPSETRLIRKEFGKAFLIVTPGVRPACVSAHDQKRVATPKEAIKAGADFIVVGRAIIEANDPAAAARNIIKEIGS